MLNENIRILNSLFQGHKSEEMNPISKLQTNKCILAQLKLKQRKLIFTHATYLSIVIATYSAKIIAIVQNYCKRKTSFEIYQQVSINKAMDRLLQWLSSLKIPSVHGLLWLRSRVLYVSSYWCGHGF